jgi:tetratricopeptide (TPR) repeat protein
MDTHQYAKALEYFQKIHAAQPEDDITIYNIACSYSLLKDKTNALAWLKKAVDSGITDKATISEDKDLEFIRNEPEYKALMAGLK